MGRYGPEDVHISPSPRLLRFNPWSPDGSFVVQKMVIFFPVPVF